LKENKLIQEILAQNLLRILPASEKRRPYHIAKVLIQTKWNFSK